MLSRWLALAALTLASSVALTHGPTRQKVVEKIAVDAPADAVWAQIKDFDDKVVTKMAVLVDSWGADESLLMLGHLEHRMCTKQVGKTLHPCWVKP